MTRPGTSREGPVRGLTFVKALPLVLVILSVMAAESGAETYGGIGYLDTFGMVKGRFPGGSFERQSPAWAQESDVMYKVTGAGLPGTIIITFYDSRPWARNELAKIDADTTQTDSTVLQKM